jgi:nucleoside-diphosphate-sugar epimerase
MKRITMTGGSGEAGKSVVRHLLDHGYQMFNLGDQNPDEPRARTDITNSGQVFNALSSDMGSHEFDADQRPVRPDAAVTFAAIPCVPLRPGNELSRINTRGSCTVIGATVKLGIPKVIIAPSETIYGTTSETIYSTTFAYEHRDPLYFPLDEEEPVDPVDSCARSKVVNERTARAFSLWSGTDIFALRIGNVLGPHEYELFADWFKDPGFRKRITWSYIDARDVGEIITK